MRRQLQLAEGEKPVPFWRFAGPVIAGSLAARGAAWAAGNVASDAHPTTRKTAATFVGLGTFWLVAGLTWVGLNRKG